MGIKEGELNKTEGRTEGLKFEKNCQQKLKHKGQYQKL